MYFQDVAAAIRQTHVTSSGAPLDTIHVASAAADNGGLSAIPPNALAAGAGSRSNSGRSKAPAVVPCGHASGHLSTPSSSVHGKGTTNVVNALPGQTAVGAGQHPLAAAHAAEPVIPGSRENEMSSMIHAIELMLSLIHI